MIFSYVLSKPFWAETHFYAHCSSFFCAIMLPRNCQSCSAQKCCNILFLMLQMKMLWPSFIFTLKYGMLDREHDSSTISKSLQFIFCARKILFTIILRTFIFHGLSWDQLSKSSVNRLFFNPI